MQRLIDRGVPPHAAAVMVANKDKGKRWRVVTKGQYESAVWWLQYNQRKFRDELCDELNPNFFAKRACVALRALCEEERLLKLSPQKREELLQFLKEQQQRIQQMKGALEAMDGPLLMCRALLAILEQHA
jgi:hypothetical protein